MYTSIILTGFVIVIAIFLIAMIVISKRQLRKLNEEMEEFVENYKESTYDRRNSGLY